MKTSLSILCALGALCVSLPAADGRSGPNILLIVADDLGYGDLGCYGATRIKTPQLDRLAGEGVRLTDAHSPAAVCQPTRYAILSFLQGTGGFALRQGDWVYLPKQGSCGMTVQVPTGPPWGQPYGKLCLVNSDVDGSGRVKAGSPEAQLYNLAADPGQATNVAAREPQRVDAMQQRLRQLTARPKPGRPPAADGRPAGRSVQPPPGSQPSNTNPDARLVRQ